MSDHIITRWQEITQTLRPLFADQRQEARQTAIERADVGQWPPVEVLIA